MDSGTDRRPWSRPRKVAVAFLGVVAALGMAGTALADVTNGGFEQPSVVPGSYANDGPSGIPGWRVSSGNINIVDKGFLGGYPVHGGNQSLDLNGDRPGAIFQDVPTTAGNSYQLVFYLSGYPYVGCTNDDSPFVKTLTVSAGPASQSYSYASVAGQGGNQPFAQEMLSFTGQAGSTSTRIQFTSTTVGCSGPILDDVSVADVSSTGGTTNGNGNATPELGSGELLATGLLPIGVALLYRRRARQRVQKKPD